MEYGRVADEKDIVRCFRYQYGCHGLQSQAKEEYCPFSIWFLNNYHYWGCKWVSRMDSMAKRSATASWGSELRSLNLDMNFWVKVAAKRLIIKLIIYYNAVFFPPQGRCKSNYQGNLFSLDCNYTHPASCSSKFRSQRIGEGIMIGHR